MMMGREGHLCPSKRRDPFGKGSLRSPFPYKGSRFQKAEWASKPAWKKKGKQGSIHVRSLIRTPRKKEIPSQGNNQGKGREKGIKRHTKKKKGKDDHGRLEKKGSNCFCKKQVQTNKQWEREESIVLPEVKRKNSTVLDRGSG